MHIKQQKMTTTDYLRTLLKTILVVLALSSTNGVRAQHLQASLSHYSTENGMPSNTVSSLANDDYGYIWMGTWNGVSRFDGYKFYNYKTGIASGVRGLHNRVDKITIDQSQNVWLKMYDGKMFVINRQTDCIEDPLRGIGGHEEFVVDYFFDPYVTTSGDVLISYKDVGLYKLRLDRNGVKQQLITTNQLTANCIVEGYHNDLWIGTRRQGVFVLNTVSHELRHYQYSADKSYTVPSNEITCLLRTSEGVIYVGTSWGLCRFERETENFMWYFEIGSTTRVTSLTEDKDGNCSKSFKSFITAFENSNNCGAIWGDKFAAQFKNKKIGGVFGEVENEYNGKVTMRHELRWFCSDDKVDGAAIPAAKRLSGNSSDTLGASSSGSDAPDVNVSDGTDEEVPW